MFEHRELMTFVPSSPRLSWAELVTGCVLVCAMVFVGGLYA